MEFYPRPFSLTKLDEVFYCYICFERKIYVIKINNLKKIYESKKNDVHALVGATLNVQQGEIYGIIGMSGAGKSTLLRCIGLLEDVNPGEVIIDGQDVSQLQGYSLRKFRHEIGIIFQGYHLFEQKTVAKNIAFPLEIADKGKKEIEARVKELLKLVDLEDKYHSYPSQLSGGQQQRVAIARALANNPKILLCDEPTSALDPITIESVLDLLEKINRELGVTIVIITHEFTVVERVCDKVAVLDKGSIVEDGFVKDVFQNPSSDATKKLFALGGGIA